jgi:hypothetical protein
MIGPEFNKVEDLLAADEEFKNSHALILPKRNGLDLGPIVPLCVTPGSFKGTRFLYFEGMIEDQTIEISVDNLLGLGTCKGQKEYQKQLLLKFNYFTPKTNSLERKQRRVLVTDIYYGVHPLHFGEKPDYYFVGEDTQYTDRPKAERKRYFPFWRVGLHGDSKAQLPIFLLAKERTED